MQPDLDVLLLAPCFAGIEIADLERISLRRAEFAPGEWVFTPHTPSRDVLFVAEGAVEILDASRRDNLRRVTQAGRGDVVGEHRWLRDAPPWAARADGPAVLLRWPEAEAAAFFEAHPETRQALEFLGSSRRMALGRAFPWLVVGETVHGLARRHPALLLRALLLPCVLITTGLGVLAIGALGASVSAVAVGSALPALGLALAVWNALDWRNDYYIITDRRVVWLEKVIGLYDNRQESPLKMILSVAVNSGWVGRQLGFGDVELRTYTGAITFENTPHPQAFAATIETLGRRLQRTALEADRETIQQALEARLTSGGAPTRPMAPPPRRDDERTQAQTGLDRWSFEARFEESGVITYRKHLAVLFQRLAPPTLVLFGLAALVAAALSGALGYASSASFGPLVGASAVAAALWWLYEYADWANDLYQITPTHIVSVHKKPLGRESRKVAPLENILGTQVDRRGPIGVLLNFGDVVANVGASTFVFEGVLNPSAAQQDIVRSQEALVDRRLEAERQRRQGEMVEWLAAYHERTHGAAPGPTS